MGWRCRGPDGIYYVNLNEMPWLLQMVETRRADGSQLIPGEKDYMLYCAACHGLDKKGNLAVESPSLVDIGKRKTRTEIEQITRQGGGRMPGYATMPEAQRTAILNYILNTSSLPLPEKKRRRPTKEGATPRPTPSEDFDVGSTRKVTQRSNRHGEP